MNNNSTYSQFISPPNSIISITRVGILALQAAGTIIPEQRYLITDSASGVVSGIIVIGRPDGKGVYTKANGQFLNADFQMTGNYTGVINTPPEINFDSIYGVWSSAQEEVEIKINGQVVIWNNFHYILQKKSNMNGMDPATNPDAYYLLAKTFANVGYIEVWDEVDYDFDNDIIIFRYDKRGNKINTNSLNIFDWGSFRVANIVQNGDSYMNVQNCWGMSSISGVDNSRNSIINFNQNNGGIYFSITGNQQTIDCVDNLSSIELNINGFNIGVYAQRNIGEIKAYLYNNSYLQANNTHATSIIQVRLYDQSHLYTDYNAGIILNGEFSKECIATILLEEGTTHENCKYAMNGTFVFPTDVNYYEKELTASKSTFNHEMFIPVGSLVIPNYAGVIRFTNGEPGTSVITDISAAMSFPRTFTVSTGSDGTVTFNNSVDLVFPNPTTTVTLAANDADFITFKYNPITTVTEQIDATSY